MTAVFNGIDPDTLQRIQQLCPELRRSAAQRSLELIRSLLDDEVRKLCRLEVRAHAVCCDWALAERWAKAAAVAATRDFPLPRVTPQLRLDAESPPSNRGTPNSTQLCADENNVEHRLLESCRKRLSSQLRRQDRGSIDWTEVLDSVFSASRFVQSVPSSILDEAEKQEVAAFEAEVRCAFEQYTLLRVLELQESALEEDINTTPSASSRIPAHQASHSQPHAGDESPSRTLVYDKGPQTPAKVASHRLHSTTKPSPCHVQCFTETTPRRDSEEVAMLTPNQTEPKKSSAPGNEAKPTAPSNGPKQSSAPAMPTAAPANEPTAGNDPKSTAAPANEPKPTAAPANEPKPTAGSNEAKPTPPSNGSKQSSAPANESKQSSAPGCEPKPTAAPANEPTAGNEPKPTAASNEPKPTPPSNGSKQSSAPANEPKQSSASGGEPKPTAAPANEPTAGNEAKPTTPSNGPKQSSAPAPSNEPRQSSACANEPKPTAAPANEPKQSASQDAHIDHTLSDDSDVKYLHGQVALLQGHVSRQALELDFLRLQSEYDRAHFLEHRDALLNEMANLRAHLSIVNRCKDEADAASALAAEAFDLAVARADAREQQLGMAEQALQAANEEINRLTLHINGLREEVRAAAPQHDGEGPRPRECPPPVPQR